MAEVQKVIAPKPEISVIASVDFSTKNYKKGQVYRGGGGGGKLLCGCEACQNLLKAVNAAKGVIDLDEIRTQNLAQVKKVKQSLDVATPGFYLLPGLAKKTEGKFTHVFFAEPGKFSLVSIYKDVRAGLDTFKDGLLTGRLRKKLDEKQLGSFGNTFGLVFPLFTKNRTALERKTPSWKPIEKVILAAIRDGKIPEKEEEVVDGDIFVIFDRFIPMLYDGVKAVTFLSPSKVDAKGLIPGLAKNKDEAKSSAYCNEKVSELLRNMDNSGHTDLLPFAYDPVKKQLVYSLEIGDVIHNWVKDNAKKLKGDVSAGCIKLAKKVPSPKAFFDAMNENLRRNGAPSFTAVKGVPGKFDASYSKHNFKNGGNDYGNASEYGYSVSVSFNDKPEIGQNGRRAGSITVRTNEELNEFILIMSSWCQRVTSWSKNVDGVVDQHYNIWPIADWLSGPYAEREGLEQKEVPLVFCGNKARTSKRDVLADLRNRLANL